MKSHRFQTGSSSSRASILTSARKSARLLTAAAALAALCSAPAVHADTATYVLPDIGTFAGFQNTNTADSYTGDGFVGLFGPRVGNAFVHMFGIELADFSRTALNVDISALQGSTINSATLSFNLLEGAAAPQTVTATSFHANGTLAHSFDPPSNLGSSSHLVTGQTANALDVTSLLAARVGSGEDWFGLYLNGSTEQQFTYTYTFADGMLHPDRAQVRLNVDYTPCAVPEPGSMALLATGVGSLLFRRRRRHASC